MEPSRAAELIDQIIHKFGKPGIRYKIVSNLSSDLEACIDGRSFHKGHTIRYDGLIRFDKATVLRSTKSRLVCLTLHELAHSAPKAIKDLQREERIKAHIKQILGKRAIEDVCWGHGKAWKKTYKRLISKYRASFPGVLKTRDVKRYYE